MTITERYVSVHSEDRNMVKYPNSNIFSLELPSDITNVLEAQLIEWTFPSNYYTFSKELQNLKMFFGISAPGYPEFNVDTSLNKLEYDIYTVLMHNRTKEYSFFIREGFYTPNQMRNELRERFNKTVQDELIYYFNNPSEINGVVDVTQDFQNNNFASSIKLLEEHKYNKFEILYDEVKQKMLFGNSNDQFTINITSHFDKTQLNNKKYREFSNWGLPSHLGFNLCDITSTNKTPELFHLNQLPDLEGGYWVEPINTTNMMGPSHFYIEIDELNCIDETSNFILNNNTMLTNLTNGRVKSAFAKIPIESTPTTQYYGQNASTRKTFYPKKSKIRKLNIKCRYHNGMPVLRTLRVI